MLIRSDVSGMSVLSGLRASVESFPMGELSPPPSTTLDTTPQPHTAGFPCHRTPPPACPVFSHSA
jgi:hypothetical protein